MCPFHYTLLINRSYAASQENHVILNEVKNLAAYALHCNEILHFVQNDNVGHMITA